MPDPQINLFTLEEDPFSPIDHFDDEYRFLSNFYPCSVIYDEVTYDYLENAYVASKTIFKFLREPLIHMTPGQAKRYGRKKRYILREGFDDLKLVIMEKLLRQKFAPGTDLAAMLIATGKRELIEGNTWGDTFWGVCNGKGSNHLGRLLMKIRDELNALH